MSELQDFLATAQDVARGAGRILLDMLGKTQHIHYKGEMNLVTEADRRAEDYILTRLRSQYPDHSILSEESGSYELHSSCKWIVDPLDGTTNFAHGYPHFAVSIALERSRELVVGAVYNPVLGEMYAATVESPAALNDAPLQVSTIARLADSLLATGFPYDLDGRTANLVNFGAFLGRAQAIRRPGVASLDLCAVAAGRFDGFWEPSLAPWDVAAGALIVLQAGGQLSNFAGQPFSIYVPEILASNGHIHSDLVKVLAEAGR